MCANGACPGWWRELGTTGVGTLVPRSDCPLWLDLTASELPSRGLPSRSSLLFVQSWLLLTLMCIMISFQQSDHLCVYEAVLMKPQLLVVPQSAIRVLLGSVFLLSLGPQFEILPVSRAQNAGSLSLEKLLVWILTLVFTHRVVLDEVIEDV